MARAYLLSHGARIGSAAETFVPAGRRIAFYAEYDENVLRENGLAALNSGDIQPTETLEGPCKVANYYHAKFEDEAIAQHLAVTASTSGGKSYYVGSDLPDPSWLCTTPAACQATYPQHSAGCQGVFKQITEEEIFSVACRGLAGAQGKTTMELGGTTELDQENEAEAKRILAWAQTDPDAAMAYWQSLNQATQALVASSWNPLKTFAQQYFAGGGQATPEAVLEGRRYLEAYDESTFYQWVSQMEEGGRQRELILADHDLAAAYRRGWAQVDPRGALFDGAPPQQGQGDPVAVLAHRIDEEAMAIATAVSLFTASEEDDVDSVAVTFSALMNDVQEYQNTAGPDHAQTAASLYSVGAEVGVKLAMHQEQHDESSRAELVEAVSLLGQWTKSLTTG